MVNVLTAIKYGYILKNEDEDVPEELRSILARYEIGNTRTLINI
ncbi:MULTISPECIES: hypothetical protein [unclassified Anabaena]|nr:MULTISPECIES: hypothetical protein [unclassified Anabaena]